MARLLPQTQAAIERARRSDTADLQAWPGAGSTRVYKAVEAITQKVLK